MKQLYESEVLFQLMERDGFNIPSSVPPYEAEIKSYLINQVKQAYPKLTDYEAEWLLYNYTKHLPAEFPISSVSGVTEATFENVVPFAYQSAILKGQTLVNLIKGGDVKKEITYSSGTKAKYYFNKSMLKANVDYLLIYEVTDFSGDDSNISFNENNDYGITRNYFNKNGIHKTKVNFSDVGAIKDFIIFYKTTGLSLGGFINNVMLVEYQEGMENWNIPYFEGMQSVKMPVLFTHSNDNLLNVETLVEGGYWGTNGTVKSHSNSLYSEEYLFVKYYEKIKIDKSNVQVMEYDENKSFIKRVQLPTDGVYTINEGVCFVRISIFNLGLAKKIMVSVGDSSVPFTDVVIKSNILTVNEDVTLRSNGSVYDELDLLTGKLTQRIDEEGSVLTQEVVKTVDLKTINESGETVYFMPLEGTMNVQSSAEIIQPTFDMSVPVEATTQNLASFINMELEE